MNEALTLLKRQAELETAMKRPGGIRITEEQELHTIRRRLLMQSTFLQRLKTKSFWPHARQTVRVMPLEREVKIEINTVTFGMRQAGNLIS